VRILVTGGSGYVGSHVARLLKQQGHEPVIVDRVAGQRTWATEGITIYQGDIADAQGMIGIFEKHKFEAVIHLAASSLVGESVTNPLLYYANNVGNTGLLLEICKLHNVDKIVFSSTSAVYGQVDPEDLPTQEWYPKYPNNAYGSSKLTVEYMLRDVEVAHGIRSVCLRYFNASGASPDGAIGEFREQPTHLIPSLAAVALGKREQFVINGFDYDTPDGTAIRDYCHVWDIARAHILALDYLNQGNKSIAVNIGAGKGHSVLEILEEFQTQWGSPIFYKHGPRRPGDIEINYADVGGAEVLGWVPERSTPKLIVEDAIRWYRSDLYKRLSNG
jgi:UDP-glucose 4-epimerase